MTRDQWRQLHRDVRSRRKVHSDPIAGYYLLWSDDGRLGVSRRHPHGHLIAQSAIPRVLAYAAACRHIIADHRIFMDRVRQLRKRGTWL